MILSEARVGETESTEMIALHFNMCVSVCMNVAKEISHCHYDNY